VSSKWVTRSGPSEVRWSAPGGLGIGTLTSSQSDGDLSDVTVLDIGLETDAAILGFDRYSDVSEEPGSPSAAASLDRTAALARATMSSAAAEGTSADDPELPSTLDLTEYNEDISQSTGISHIVSTEGSDQSCGVGPSVLGTVTSPVGTHPPNPGAAAHPAP